MGRTQRPASPAHAGLLRAARVSSMTACSTVPDEALPAMVQEATREHRRDRRSLEQPQPEPDEAVDDAMPDRRMQGVGTHRPPSSSSVCRFKAGTSLDSSITLAVTGEPWAGAPRRLNGLRLRNKVAKPSRGAG